MLYITKQIFPKKYEPTIFYQYTEHILKRIYTDS